MKRASAKNRNEPAKPEVVELSVEGLGPWLNEEFSGKEAGALKELSEACTRIEAGFGGIAKALEALEKATFSIEGREEPRVNMIKEGFVTKAKTSLGWRSPAREKTYASFQQFLADSKKAAREAGAATPKQGYVLSNYFKAEGRELSEAVHRLEAELDQLGEKLKREHAFLGVLDAARKETEDLHIMRKQADFLEKKLKGTLLKRKETECMLRSEKAKLAGLKAGVEWKALEADMRSLEGLRGELERLEGILKTDAGSVSRLMRKFGHETGDRNAMEFSERPVNALLSMSRESIASMLDKVAEAVRKGSIGVKESERRKVEGFAKGIREVVEKRDNIIGLREEIRKMEIRLSSSAALAEERRLADSIGSLEQELGSIGEEESGLKAELAKLKESAEAKCKSVEGMLAGQGYVVRLKL